MANLASLLAQAATPMLDPPTRAVLLMSLLAFVVLGMGLMLGVTIGGRWVRRLGTDDLRKPLPLRRRDPVASDHLPPRPTVRLDRADTAVVDPAASDTRSA